VKNIFLIKWLNKIGQETECFSTHESSCGRRARGWRNL